MNAAEPPVEKKPDYTSQRVFLEDAAVMGKLASLRGKTIAEIYREICAPVVRDALRAESQSLANDLGGGEA